MLLSLRAVFDQMGYETANDVAVAVAHSPDIGEGADRELLSRRLAALLGAECVTLFAHAQDLLSEHDNVLAEARVLTDIRPLFNENQPDLIEGAVIGHHLRLRLLGRDPRTVDVALDDVDLARLAEAIERASLKEKRLRSAVQDMGVPLVIPYSGTSSRDPQ
jgi:predicted amidohydrolase